MIMFLHFAFRNELINHGWNVGFFFKKRNIAVLTIRELFDFIVDPTISDASIDSYSEEVCNLACASEFATLFNEISLLNYGIKNEFLFLSMI